MGLFVDGLGHFADDCFNKLAGNNRNEYELISADALPTPDHERDRERENKKRKREEEEERERLRKKLKGNPSVIQLSHSNRGMEREIEEG